MPANPRVPGVFSCPGEGHGCLSLDVDALLSATQAAEYAGVSVNVIVNWRNRGWLPVATGPDGREVRDGRGRPRYRLLDVAKAEHATAQRARR